MRRISVVLGGLLFVPLQAFAHCDGMDGPVVKAAQAALEKGDVNRVLIWVKPEDEPQIKKAFVDTMNVRKLSPQARELADRYFFETLVRVHRAGEGAPYTGIKPAGRDLGPAIPAADQALERGSVDALRKLLTNAISEGLDRHFKEVMAKKSFKTTDVQAGRDYVKAYVEFIHYAEGLYRTATGAGAGHDDEAPEPTAHHHE